ncbi:MAG: hypothetical protein AMXMBFR57_02980 [Acidimicrobiia bacterium]
MSPDAFIERWKAAGGNELANYQLFLTELTELLDLPRPEPASGTTSEDKYVFERQVRFIHGDGSESFGRIDLYRRGCFVAEAKKVRQTAARGFDDALMRARGQAEAYARALPADEGRPPFLLIVDVGNVIRLFADFTRSGATYTPFPDPRSYEIRLEHLRDEAVRTRLQQVWRDPMGLDPSRKAAAVTRIIARQLADIAVQLEEAGHSAEDVAGFLTRCLFTYFAEDVELIPKRSFATLLDGLIKEPAHFVPMVEDLWKTMDAGGLSLALKSVLPQFNGKLFKNHTALPLNKAQIEALRKAANADWQLVEPAIFGTLLERALDPRERHALGAHYTPRAYVERLVLPTIVEPLRDDWKHAQTAALTLAAEGKARDAEREVRAFLQRLCQVRVLDPACGSGNFLYVTLEHLKRLEGEVLLQLESLGVSMTLEATGFTVDPHQFLGIEINPRAAAIAELVLWIGYLQWHFRTRGHVLPAQPVLRNFRNIECRDAVLAYDAVEPQLDDAGQPVTRWDGITTKTHPVTGEQVPDDTARVTVQRYINPRPATWPEADFIVGNPPFIGTKRMKQALGEGYTDALRDSWPDVPESADFVLYWWHHAAELLSKGAVRQFGLISTNSLRQTFNRQVLELHLVSAERPISLVFAVPDHPWVDSTDGAAVRIAMTVCGAGVRGGRLLTAVAESDGLDDERTLEFEVRHGRVGPNLSVGADLTTVVPMGANGAIAGMGVALHGAGFILNPDQAAAITPYGPDAIRGYVAGRDLLQEPRRRYLIDFTGKTEVEARAANPAAFQHVVDYVKPERDHNRRDVLRRVWWRFGWERPVLRRALEGLNRYICTTETSKHRPFQFVDGAMLADHSIVCIATSDALHLGVMSSHIHVTWALAAGGTLEDRPRYNKTRCFDPFPFPVPSDDQAARIRELGEQLDAHRKRQQAAHPTLTLTGMYNVLEKLRAGEALTEKDKVIHEQGLVSVLRQIHDDLDVAVLEAYGWSDLAPMMRDGRAGRELDEQLLTRLVALNAERAAEEARGLVRWLRPEFQNPAGSSTPTQAGLDTGDEDRKEKAGRAPSSRQAWPKDLTDQVRLVASALSTAVAPQSSDDVAALFSGGSKRPARVAQILEMLAALGRARDVGDGRFVGQ